MSKTRIFRKIDLVESHFVQHTFCCVPSKSHTVGVRFSPFSETQIFAILIPLKPCFIHCCFCLVPFKSRICPWLAFQPSLMLVSKAEKPTRDIHSSLFGPFVSHEKKLLNLGPD